MKRINRGAIINGQYVKHISFSRAVLWMTRELSLRKSILLTLKWNGIKELVFIDDKKKERWEFQYKDISESGHLKQVGQEEQWYFPIGIAKVIKIENTPLEAI